MRWLDLYTVTMNGGVKGRSDSVHKAAQAFN